MSMTAIEHVMNYAAAFEETYIDDNWERITPFFSEDAVYVVEGGPLACKLTGRDSILKGLKKSVDGLDRRCDSRQVEITDGPRTEVRASDEQVSLSWRASYSLTGAPDVSFPGRSVVTVIDGKITELRDVYVDADLEGLTEWMLEYGSDLDGSYE